ncbi:hypothetical protein [Actinomadura violacea]|uniref:Uncharacterized protein n=1 Tax=Actinomadura violacea TaxID=2819934 RepID=A0ABS3RHJ7_9ACTN|nr:hypothetical protein [Actinomadura violacea]MBO2456033.1 hypothetical protein [Actinomadura violacea]
MQVRHEDPREGRHRQPGPHELGDGPAPGVDHVGAAVDDQRGRDAGPGGERRRPARGAEQDEVRAAMAGQPPAGRGLRSGRGLRGGCGEARERRGATAENGGAEDRPAPGGAGRRGGLSPPDRG